MVKRFFSVILLIALAFSLCGCIKSTKTDNKVSIVATIFPAYDFARAVAGDRADITMLLPPGAEIHTFEPTPMDMMNIQSCDLFIYNGGESDEWVRTLLSSNEYKDINALCMMDCVSLLEEPDTGIIEAENNDEQESDEHIWTSPLNAVRITMAIAYAISNADPDNTAYYMSNADTYTQKLYEINDKLHAVSDKIENRVMIFADRFPMYYFTEEYGFRVYAAFPGCSSQTEPSAATVTSLIDIINEEKIPAVFCIEFSSRRLADMICGETGAKCYTLHSCHNISSDDFKSGKTYLDIMNDNLQTIKEAYGV